MHARYAVPNAAAVAASPTSSTAKPATTPPTGTAAEHPAMTTPHTRARSASGTRSKIDVSMIGFSAPTNRPHTALATTSTGTSAPSATRKNRGGPPIANATKNVVRLGSRWPIALNSSAPTSAAAPMTPTSSPSAARLCSTFSA